MTDPRPADVPWLTPYLTVRDSVNDDGTIIHVEMTYRGQLIVMFALEDAYGSHAEERGTNGAAVLLPLRRRGGRDFSQALAVAAKGADRAAGPVLGRPLRAIRKFERLSLGDCAASGLSLGAAHTYSRTNSSAIDISMPRFHVDGPLPAGQLLTLPDDVVRHLHVLRLQTGDAVTPFDGRGGEYRAESLSISPNARRRRASANTIRANRSRLIASCWLKASRAATRSTG